MSTINIRLPRLHVSQQRILTDSRRFNVACMGRRFGKTVFGLDRLIQPALAGFPSSYYLPTHKMMEEVWRTAKSVLLPVVSRINAQQHRIELITGGVIDFWSLENADAIRGRRYARAVIDEAAMVKDLATAWQQVIRPTLTDFKGDAYLLSTPRGHNFFYECFQRGLDPAQTDWAAFQMPTTANPYIDASEVESARLELPERVYEQEYLARFLDSGGGVFRKVREACCAVAQVAPIADHRYVFGVDWARSGDFTCVSVFDVTTREQVLLDRFNQVDYATQVGRLTALYERFRPTVIVAESNSMGGPLVESLRSAGLPVQPFYTTNSTKTEIIDGLALAFERAELLIVDDPIQYGELLAFESERLPSGMIRYAAASGHDDTVMALALSLYAAGRCSPGGYVDFA